MNQSKTTNKATAAQAGVLAEFARLRAALMETHSQIPQLLARQRDLDRVLGLNESEELRRQLADVATGRENAVRRRAATIDAILSLEPALQAERATVEHSRQEHAVEAVTAFQARYEAAVGALQTLWAEGEALARVLRTDVRMPLPVRLQTSPIDGTTRAQPLRSDAVAVVPVDSVSAQLGEQLSQLDGALTLIFGIKQSHELDQRQYHLARNRGVLAEFPGVYRTLIRFSGWDGLEFEPGELVDQTLLGSGMMHRLTVGRRYIAPVEMVA